MKPKEGFLLREVDNTSIVVATGAAATEFSGLITLNQTGTFLWRCLENGATEDELVTKLLAEYEIDEACARRDVQAFVKSAKDAGLLED